MELSNFDFILPKRLIAQEPIANRDHSQLLIVQEDGFALQHFYNIVKYLQPGDLLCFNDSKVIKSRLITRKDGMPIEIFLNKPISQNVWHGFAKPTKKLKVNDELYFDDNKITILNKLEWGQVEVSLDLKLDVIDFFNRYGHLPLPPYIKREANAIDESQYQTVYANRAGSVAAPTAGLHFSKELLEKIKNIGVQTAFVTLHVGAGTFLPIKSDNVLDHKMHSENFHIHSEDAAKINKAKSENRKIISVGTTTLRALESGFSNGLVHAGQHSTDIFIKPGFQFNVVDQLITNLHLPKSTLLILVSAFAGKDLIDKAYLHAIDNNLRFFSYGDAMLLTRKN
jgi:S-adenosylmethionine:tRNA ribosyltransferase-isomerase